MVLAAVEEQQGEEGAEELVAAVKKFGRFQRAKKPAKDEGQAGGAVASKGAAAGRDKKKLVSLQLCWRHAKYGAAA
jgi:hypothetical protein